ncbi:MAG: 50S ribosomal protein L18 [Candidatus Verstraetearchaeota archaeon]|nr:50S ribosomal protein L18 [Candidatus Verstraetearchaeota archaeon]
MAKGTIYRVYFRRRREGRTDYRLRKRLISSRIPRLVIRRSLKHTYLQVVEAKIEGDRVIACASTAELAKFGWKAGTGNVPAAYLAGYLAGKRAIARGVAKAIVDINGYGVTKSNRILSAMKGAIDAGLDIPHSEEVLPEEDRLKGTQIAEYASLLQSNDPAKYQRTFSAYLKKSLPPEVIVEHFASVKEAIEKEVK